MEFQDFTNAASEVIEGPERAESAVKAVLGIVASHIDEDHARDFVSALPEPLTLERLRSHQQQVQPLGYHECLGLIGQQFNLGRDAARRLVMTVLHCAKEALGEDRLRQDLSDLGRDWDDIVAEA